MAGDTNFPTGLDDNASLYEVIDNTTPLIAAHHNNLKAAMIAVQDKIGIHNANSPTVLDSRLGHPTYGHVHSGASGQGRQLNATSIPYSGALPASNVGEAIDAAGFTPVVFYAECNATHAVSQATSHLMLWDSFYDSAQAAIGSPPAESGLSYATGQFTAEEAGVWVVNGGVDLVPSIGSNSNMFLSVPNYGFSPEFRYATGANPVPYWVFSHVVVMATGDVLNLRLVNPHPSATQVLADDYAALDIVRISSRFG